MHEFAEQLIRRRPAENAHAGAVDIDRIIHEAVEPAILDLDESAAIGNMDPIIMTGENLAVGRRDDLETSNRDVLGILGQQPKPRAVMEVEVFDRRVLAIDDEQAGMVALAVPQDKNTAYGGPSAEVVM